MSGVACKVLETYIHWQNNARNIPKIHRYSIGIRIDNLFAMIIENISEAIYSTKETRKIHIQRAINKNDVLKFMLLTLFEIKGIEEDKFEILSLKIEEIGRILYGWKNQILEQNRKNNTITHHTDSVFNGKNKK